MKAVKKHCPQTLIVFDKYHLIASYNRDVIDEVRRAKQRNKLKNNSEYKVYKHSRWLLLKNRENLKEKEADNLKKFAKKLDKYCYEIVDYAIHSIHTSILEEVDNKLKVR
ncbi:MAG: transposase [Halanaerobiales bacterium]|nr:transposase [Halanaerobiales bacterium]